MQARKQKATAAPAAAKGSKKRQKRGGKRVDATVQHQTLEDLLTDVQQTLAGSETPQDPRFIIQTVFDAVKDAPLDETFFKGRIILPSGTTVNITEYELYMFSRQVDEDPLSKEQVEDIIFIEFSSNLKKNADGTFELYQHHFVGFEGADLSGAPLPIDDDSTTLESLIDFLWNVTHLGLCTEEALNSFLADSSVPDERLLLTQQQVDALVSQGEHVEMPEEDIQKADKLISAIKTFSLNLTKSLTG